MLRELVPLSIRRSLGGRWDRWMADRARARLLRSLRGDAVECNVCGWLGAAFTDDCWHPGTICPACGSQVRHRLLVAMLDGLSTLPRAGWRDFFAGKSVLHFAPERQFRECVRAASGRYLTADFARGDCDLRLDLADMRSVAEAAFDTLIACDVLEHIPDDHAAFREIRRVLTPGGTAMLTVPQKDPPATTDEGPAGSDAERERRFGQKDHVRLYGDDFASRAAAAGFQVAVLDCNSFPGHVASRYVLRPPSPSADPRATNHRRLYILSAAPTG